MLCNHRRFPGCTLSIKINTEYLPAYWLSQGTSRCASEWGHFIQAAHNLTHSITGEPGLAAGIPRAQHAWSNLPRVCEPREQHGQGLETLLPLPPVVLRPHPPSLPPPPLPSPSPSRLKAEGKPTFPCGSLRGGSTSLGPAEHRWLQQGLLGKGPPNRARSSEMLRCLTIWSPTGNIHTEASEILTNYLGKLGGKMKLSI